MVENIKEVADSINGLGQSIDEVIHTAFVTVTDENDAKSVNITDALLKIESQLQGTQHGNTIADALFDIAKAINKLSDAVEKTQSISGAIEELSNCLASKE